MGVAQRQRSSPKTPRSVKKEATVDIDALLASLKTCAVTPRPTTRHLFLDESKREQVGRDILLLGYHIILRFGVASAVLTKDRGSDILSDRLSGKIVRWVCRGYDSDGGSPAPSPRTRRRSHIEI